MASVDATLRVRGYTVGKDQAHKRLRHSAGQVCCVPSMVDDSRYCIDALTPFTAAVARLIRG